MGVFDRLKKGLYKTRKSIIEGLDIAFGDYSEVDDDFFDELLDVLIMSDVGIKASERIISETKAIVKKEHLKKPDDVKNALIDSILNELTTEDPIFLQETFPLVILVVGVNGVGKTTSIGKLAARYAGQKKKVVLAAADTYRAAANEQLKAWADRADAMIVSSTDSKDPASVVYEAIDVFNSKKADVLICDTAGRLHNKKNLMEEISRINRILEKRIPLVRKQVYLVLDATTGQNAISQAREFSLACKPTGIILTKMDGSARGGIVIAISSEFNIPVKYIGVGERPEDLMRFDPREFVRAIFY